MKTIGIYPDTSQPPTKAHLNVYNKLKHIVGPDTFIVTTDHTPTPEAPLNFGDKEQIWVRHGVPASHIRKVDDWKNPEVILSNFSKEHTSIVYALNAVEAAKIQKRKEKLGHIKNKITGDVNKEVWLDDSGELNYFQPYTDVESMKPDHSYILIIDDGKIEGRPVTTQNIRQVLGSDRYQDDAKKRFFRFIFGWFDVGLYTLITSKFKLAHQVSNVDTDNDVEVNDMPSKTPMVNKGRVLKQKPTVPTSPRNNIRSRIQKMVREMVSEMMNEDFYSTSVNTPDSTDNMTAGTDQLKSPAEQRAEASKKRIELSRQNAQNKRNLTSLKADKNWKKKDLLSMRQQELDAQKQIDATNKLIAKPSSTTTTP